MEVPDTEENLKKCICMNCPSYNECMKRGMQGLFCARGKTDCDLERRGCICNQCPISSDYHLFGGYYCAVGTGWDEDFGKAIKALIGTAFVPLKVLGDIVGDLATSVEAAIPQPSKLASTIITARISTLKTITKAIEKEITLLEEYKEETRSRRGKEEGKG
jgi:hypothetical protein